MEEQTQANGDTPIRVGMIRMSLVLLGYCLSLPVIMIGARLGGHLGAAAAARAFVTGCGILAALGAMTAWIGVRTRLTTYEIIRQPFGAKGAHIVNGVIGATILGWFAVTLAVFADAMALGIRHMTGHNVKAVLVIAPGAAVMMATALRGFRALSLLSRITVPAMGLFLLLAAYRALGTADAETARAVAPGDVDQAVSLVVGVYVLGVSLLPDITRFARKARDAVTAVLLAVGIALPLILMASMLPAIATGHADMAGMFAALGLGVPALVVIVAAACTSNASNLYSSSLTFMALAPRLSARAIVIGAGLAGTGLALLDMGDLFVRFLSLLSVAIPPVCGIYIADHLLGGHDQAARGPQPAFGLPAFAAWGWAIAAAFPMQAAWPALCAIPAINSVLAAFLLHLAFTRVRRLLSA